jgi:glycerol-3-phosphate acyltransferase PlsY
MANVLRTVGRLAAVLVLALDMGKAVLTVILARAFADSAAIEAAAALAVILGHNWSVFIGFRGGRGAATGLGALYALSPISGLVTTLVAVLTIGTSRYVSLGSMLGAAAGGVTLIVLALAGEHPAAYIWYGLIAMPLVIVRHKDNVKRLLRGEERKIGSPSGRPVEAEQQAGRRKGFRWSRSA